MSNEAVKEIKKTHEFKRVKTIDRYRGFALFCMIIFQFVKNVPSLGIVSRLAEHGDKGIQIFAGTTLADLVAPLFFFAIALTYKMSYDKRVKLFGKGKTVNHFILRNLALIGVGTMLGVIGDLIEGETFTIVGYIFLVLTLLVLLFTIVTLLFNIKPFKKHKKIISTITLYIVAILGVYTMGVALYDTLIKANILTGERVGYWLVLQSLGMAGLIALPFIMLNLKLRSVLGVALLALYTIYYNLFDGADKVIGGLTQGGFLGGFGWSLIIIFGSVFHEFYTKDKKQALIGVASTIALALIMYFTLSVSKQGVKPDPTFIVITIALSAVVYLIFDLFNGFKSKFDPLAWWGRYPILLYFLEFAVIGLYKTVFEDFHENASTSVAIASTLVVAVLFTAIVWFLNKRNKKINF